MTMTVAELVRELLAIENQNARVDACFGDDAVLIDAAGRRRDAYGPVSHLGHEWDQDGRLVAVSLECHE